MNRWELVSGLRKRPEHQLSVTLSLVSE